MVDCKQRGPNEMSALADFDTRMYPHVAASTWPSLICVAARENFWGIVTPTNNAKESMAWNAEVSEYKNLYSTLNYLNTISGDSKKDQFFKASFLLWSLT